jgi:hypothetical protein
MVQTEIIGRRFDDRDRKDSRIGFIGGGIISIALGFLMLLP